MFYTALLFGLISSFHCVGMCGPIALMLPIGRSNPFQKFIQILLYHIGRLTSYGALGFFFGWLGRGLFLATAQQKVSIIVGVFIILISITPEKLLSKYKFSNPLFIIITRVKMNLGKQLKRKSPDVFFTIGILNGLLPCGLVYAALFGAIAMQSVGLSLLYMLIFGLGTIPLMTTIVYFSNMISLPFRQKINRLIPITTVIIGLLFIIRGLGLNIAYLSPGITHLVVQSTLNCH